MPKYFIIKNGESNSLKNYSKNSFNTSEIGAELTSSYPLTSSISFDYITGVTDKRYKIKSLKNSLKNYLYLSNAFDYAENATTFDSGTINLISIPSIFYGSSIKKGTVELSFYVTGTLVGNAKDIKQNGELIETTGLLSGSVVGIVLYNEGFIALTNESNITIQHSENYVGSTDYPKWTYFGADLFQGGVSSVSSSYNLTFNGVNKIPTLTMFLDANKGEFNHSNNPTFISSSFIDKIVDIKSPNQFKENDFVTIKNVVKSPFSGSEASFQKETYISSIAIYDKDKNIIGVAKLAKPVRKIENRELTFKLKLDL